MHRYADNVSGHVLQQHGSKVALYVHRGRMPRRVTIRARCVYIYSNDRHSTLHAALLLLYVHIIKHELSYEYIQISCIKNSHKLDRYWQAKGRMQQYDCTPSHPLD